MRDVCLLDFHLLKEIERRTKGIKGLNATLYRYCRRFYRLYPEALLTETVRDEAKPILTIKDPFVFEFLGLDTKETVSESNLEQALMDHLQEFLLEMGNGFCFEARQKRIVIDDEYYFIDLVLYNRILHCNVMIIFRNC